MAKMEEMKELDPTYKDAKMSMLKALREQMIEMMKDEPGMKKVQVEASDKGSLVHGLEKAKELLGSDVKAQDEMPEMDSSEESSEDMPMEMSEDSSGLSPEEEDMLMKLLAKKKMSV